MKVALLLSGGVDSGVALHLLLQAGHQVEAFYLQTWKGGDGDVESAQITADKMGIKLTVIPYSDYFHESIIDYTIEELKKGYTPSPCVFCNREIKFGKFIKDLSGDFEGFASGHYAKVLVENGEAKLFCAVDEFKDQTYFLSLLSRETLSKVIFPLGGYKKAEVKELATKLGLKSVERKESQGVCFIGDEKYKKFSESYLGTKSGEFIEIETGNKLGKHRGYWFYTVGQRSGLGLSGGPWFVVDKDIPANIIYLSHQKSEQKANLDTIIVQKPVLANPLEFSDLKCKLRHGPNYRGCTVVENDVDTLAVTLDEPERAIAYGQFCVFYQGERCLGGGKIIKTD